MKIFVDTNIFLDLIFKRPLYKEAVIIFNAIEKQLFEGFVLDISFINIDYIAKKQITSIYDFLSISNTIFKVVGANNEDIQNALLVNNSDLEDNLQYVISKKHKCDVIVTNDKDFYTADIPVADSKSFVERYL